MRKQSVNSKNSWQSSSKLQITKQRRWIEYLIEEKKKKDSKLSVKLLKFIKKIF